jgi:general secretion pathway protein I
MMRRPPDGSRQRGFTLIEVLVALVIVAFGMGAVLSALSASAVNVSSLREKTLAQWVALNRIADVRLDLQPPQVGTSEGDVKGFANGDWHWQQIVSNVQEIPGLTQITVRVRRTATNTSSSSGGLGGSGSGIRTTTSMGSGSSGGKDADWTTTVIGFRGTSIAAASGEVPDWTGAGSTATSGSSSSGSSGGSIANPGTSTQPGGLGSSGAPSLGPPTQAPTTPAPPGSTGLGGS